MARHLLRVDKGDHSHVALPVFILRNLTARDLYVRQGGPVRSPADIAGKRVGMYSWSASGSIWYRHLLRFLGVDPASCSWFVGTIDSPDWGVAELGLPDFVKPPLPGKSLAQMLIDGEIDALFSPPRPQRYDRKVGPIQRLFPDFQAIEQDYARASGVWPPQHLVVIRREVWLAKKSIARALTDAFIRNNEVFAATQRSFPYVTPWMETELDAIDAPLGDDAHADGLNDVNRRAMELFCEEAHRAGLTRRRISVEEYFAEYLES
jgi:4,5-dihydroxyphthalate decarboxylase